MPSSEPKVVVTIEGSVTPSVRLPRGQSQTVQLTPRVQRLIDRGFVVVTARYEIPPPKVAPPPPAKTPAPKTTPTRPAKTPTRQPKPRTKRQSPSTPERAADSVTEDVSGA